MGGIKEKEIWKTVESYPKYEVSTYGKVRNKRTKRELKPSPGRNPAYLNVYISNEKGENNRPIHRLVAETFVEGEGQCVNHIDGNKHNNYYKNLEWCSFQENNIHAIKNGLNHPGEYQKRRIRIVETGDEFNGIVECANYVGTSFQNIYAAANGKRHTAKGYHYEYIT